MCGLFLGGEKVNRWTKSEEKLLKDNYNKVSNEVLLSLFPKRTYLSIYKKARKMGMMKNRQIEFLNRSNCKKRENAYNWNGGKRKTQGGYIQILKPDHPRAEAGGYVMEHIYVFEQATGIQVPQNCVIHHLDGNKENNDISNLCLMTFGGHSTFHNKERWKKDE